MSKFKSTIKATITRICPVAFSKIFVRKIFYILLSTHLRRGLFLISIHIFLNAFRRMRASMKTVYWEASYLKYSNKHSDSCMKLQRSHCKNFWWSQVTSLKSNERHKFYLGNKEQRAMFAVVSRSGAHFGFACPIRCRIKIKPP